MHGVAQCLLDERLAHMELTDECRRLLRLPDRRDLAAHRIEEVAVDAGGDHHQVVVISASAVVTQIESPVRSSAVTIRRTIRAPLRTAS